MLVKFSCIERVPRFKSQPDTFSSFFFSLWVLQCTYTTCCNVTCINDPINRLLAIFRLPIISIGSSTSITALEATLYVAGLYSQELIYELQSCHFKHTCTCMYMHMYMYCTMDLCIIATWLHYRGSTVYTCTCSNDDTAVICRDYT